MMIVLHFFGGLLCEDTHFFGRLLCEYQHFFGGLLCKVRFFIDNSQKMRLFYLGISWGKKCIVFVGGFFGGFYNFVGGIFFA